MRPLTRRGRALSLVPVAALSAAATVGLLPFRLAATVFGTYFLIMGIMFIRAAKAAEGDVRAAPAGELVSA